jgi:hypothetical protein
VLAELQNYIVQKGILYIAGARTEAKKDYSAHSWFAMDHKSADSGEAKLYALPAIDGVRQKQTNTKQYRNKCRGIRTQEFHPRSARLSRPLK